MWQKRTRVIRFGNVIANILWIIFNISILAYFGVVTNVVVLVSTAIAIVRYDVFPKHIKFRNRKNAKYGKLKRFGKAIQSGKLVLFPTETVYGIGANAFDEVACAKIFEAKGREQDNPLIVHVADENMLLNVVEEIR